MPDLAEARRPAAAARRRGHHRRRRASRPRSTRSSRTAWSRSSSTSTCRPTTSTSTQLEPALSDRTRAIMIAHTLGNPFDLDAVTAFASEHDLWLIEDCCDAVGATYEGRHVGTFGDLATVSFYPAHHITMGEGGCVLTDQPAAEDARRVVPRLGPRLLVRPRRRQHLRQALRLAARRPARRLRPQVHLFAHRLQPEAHRHAGGRRRGAARQARRASSRPAGGTSAGCTTGSPTWRSSSSCPRRRRAPTRAGSASRSPSGPRPRSRAAELVAPPERAEDRAPGRSSPATWSASRPIAGVEHRQVGDLPNSDFVMNQAFWVGVYPGLGDEAIDYVVGVLREFVGEVAGRHVPAPALRRDGRGQSTPHPTLPRKGGGFSRVPSPLWGRVG